MKTRILISFVSERQIPYFMIIKEYLKFDGEICHAEVIYQEECRCSDIAIDGDVVMAKHKNLIKLFACQPNGGVIL